MGKGFESRLVKTNFEIKAEEENSKKIVGYAALFDDPAPETWGFIEKIAPGAFEEALKTSDVRALINHDANLLLGRNKSGTLQLKEDERGLYYEIEPPNTTYAADLMESMKRGDINQSSFQFKVDIEEWDETGDIPVRTIIKVKELRDVSPVTFPWYPNSESGLKSKEDVYKRHLENKNNDHEVIEKRKKELKRIKHHNILLGVD